MSRPKPTKQIVFDSLQQCAAITGLELERLKKAKKVGAAGFRGSRVYWLEFAAWYDGTLVDKEDIAWGAKKGDRKYGWVNYGKRLEY